jgi:protein-tyrosine-phosphatase
VETIERFLHSSFDQFASQAKVVKFLPLMAERFARQRLRALAKVEGRRDDGKPTVLFLCVHNAGRSQMAMGFFTALAGDRAVAWSGGSEPGVEVNPAAVTAMAERGIDISGEFPKPWTDETVRAAYVVITMGCGDACPVFPGKRYEEWVLDDPAGWDVPGVRPVRDEIERRVRNLLNELDLPAQAASAGQTRAEMTGERAVSGGRSPAGLVARRSAGLTHTHPRRIGEHDPGQADDPGHRDVTALWAATWAGLTARTMAPCIPGAASCVKTTSGSVKPAVVRPSRYSVRDSAPAMQPT